MAKTVSLSSGRQPRKREGWFCKIIIKQAKEDGHAVAGTWIIAVLSPTTELSIEMLAWRED